MDISKTRPGPSITPVQGFSKMTKLEKVDYLSEHFFSSSDHMKKEILKYWHPDEEAQKVFDEFSENTLSNFYLPYGVAPNFLINEKLFSIPMVIEESSVVAAASKAAKFWLNRGGFKSEIVSTTKVGQVHFFWNGKIEELNHFFNENKQAFVDEVSPLMGNMVKRGGGLTLLELRDCNHLEEGMYQLWAEFETCDAMGANFINTILEAFGRLLEKLISETFSVPFNDCQVVMAILSNYTPECLVRTWVECPIEDLHDPAIDMAPEVFAQKFARAVRVAEVDPHRATTHNKGIMNGIDAVVLATGNDFRAVEACAHTYAGRDGQYKSLTKCSIKDGVFKFQLEIPLSLGTIGGLTSLHPLARLSLEMLDRPNACQLMEIVSAVGLAQNFAALRSLTTTGIQQGHMKMHLMNILNYLEANEDEREKAKQIFEKKTISFHSVREFIAGQRSYQ
jgi:hydroxymethylglutaryl-CoA reductase